MVQRVGATELGKRQEQESHLDEGKGISSDLLEAYEEGGWFKLGISCSNGSPSSV